MTRPLADRLALLLVLLLVPAALLAQAPDPGAQEPVPPELATEEPPPDVGELPSEEGEEEPDAELSEEEERALSPEERRQRRERLRRQRRQRDEAQPFVPDPALSSFELQIPEEDGGGTIVGAAGSVEFRRSDYAVLEGGVELRYQDLLVAADRAEVDLATREVIASGNVVLDQGPQRVVGATIRYDLDTKTGTLTEATAYVDPDFYFSGKEISRTGERTFTLVDGTFTSCSDTVPDWSFSVDRATIELEGYARVHGATMRVKKVPVLYAPYLLWPAKTERASGLLVPQPGYSSRRGASMSLAYYQTLGRSYDTTFFADLYTKSFIGLGNELRYAPTEETAGRFEGFAVRDSERGDDWRWKVAYDHVTRDLPWGLRGVVTYRDYSDFDYYQDFERDFDQVTNRSIYSRGFVTGNWGTQSVNLLADRRETILGSGNVTTLARLPEAEYRLRQTQLGSLPLYLSVDSSLAFLSVDRPGAYEGDYGRFDALPTLTVPLRLAPWLSLSLNGGARVTWWNDSLCRPAQGPDDTGPDVCPTAAREFTGETLSRTFPVAGAQLIGPSFARVFERPVGAFAKFKHVIEPRWTYNFQGDVDLDERLATPLFDEVDSVATSTNVGRFTLVNRLLAKPPEEDGGSARQILSLEIAQPYSFDREQPLERFGELETQRGPLEGLLRFNPSPDTSVKAELRYSTLFDRLTSRSLTGSTQVGRNTYGLTWFTRLRANDGETTGDQLRAWTRLSLVPGRLALEAQVNYDIERDELQQQRYLVNYNSQCYSVAFEYRDFLRGGNVNDRDYRFLLTLKNVGTFLDLSGRSSDANDF